jgi:hypothetical protein
MKNESSVPAAHKMMDVTLPIFQVEVQNTADSDDRSHQNANYGSSMVKTAKIILFPTLRLDMDFTQ